MNVRKIHFLWGRVSCATVSTHYSTLLHDFDSSRSTAESESFWLLISGATPVYLSLSLYHLWCKWKTHELFFVSKNSEGIHINENSCRLACQSQHNPKLSRTNQKKKNNSSIWFSRQVEVKVSSVVLSIECFGLPAKGTCRHKIALAFWLKVTHKLKLTLPQLLPVSCIYYGRRWDDINFASECIFIFGSSVFISHANPEQCSGKSSVFVREKQLSGNLDAFNADPCDGPSDLSSQITSRSSSRIMSSFSSRGDILVSFACTAYTACALVGRVTLLTQQKNTQQIFVIQFCNSLSGEEAATWTFQTEKQNLICWTRRWR